MIISLPREGVLKLNNLPSLKEVNLNYLKGDEKGRTFVPDIWSQEFKIIFDMWGQSSQVEIDMWLFTISALSPEESYIFRALLVFFF